MNHRFSLLHSHCRSTACYSLWLCVCAVIALCCCAAPYAPAQSTDSVRTAAMPRTDSLDAEQKNIEQFAEETVTNQPLKIFGTMQTFLFFARYDNLIFDRPNSQLNQRTFALQQMDLFFRKELGSDFTFFTDIEFRLNYDSRLNFGGLSIQEAWVNYDYSSALNIKTGILFPAFNGMNEIKNRLGILPYIFRPLVYERALAESVAANELVPDRAFVQLHGTKRVHSFLFDYAVYFGNADNPYLSNNQQSRFDLLSGTNPPGISYGLIGTRIGVRNTKETFKAGLSFTYDRSPFLSNTDSLTPALRRFVGDFPRMRFGGDISFTWGKFWFESEFIKVVYDAYTLRDFSEVNYGRSFGYTTVGYNLSEAWTFYFMSQFLDGNNIGFRLLPSGVLTPFSAKIRSNNASIGTSYRVNTGIALKAQFQNTFFEFPEASPTQSNNANLTQFLLGITVNF